MTTGPEELSLNYLLDPAFQLVNTAGRPLTNGWIEVYYHGTRDKYYCASDFDGTLHPFKIPLDSLGSNIVLADPNFSYDIYVYNSFGSLQMSRYNVNPGSGSGGGSSSEGGPAEHWSSDTAGGASTTVTGGTTVYLTLPSSEDQPEFVDHATDTAIFLKEGLYHIDAVVSFKQDDEDLQNIIKDLVVNTGLMGWDAQMTGQKNWTGPESTDDDRHFLELHTVVSVPEDSLQTLYFQISSPVDLDSAAIEKLDIIKLTAGGGGMTYAAGYGIDITGQVISTSGMMPESSAANFVDVSTYNTDIENIYETIAETSAMIPSGVATEQFVEDFTSAFITEDALDGYATQEWVVDQGYITSADLPQSVPLVAGEGISIVDTSASTIISVDSAYSPGVSEEWVENYTSAFITSGALDDYVTKDEFSEVVNDLSDDISAVSAAIPSLDGYATQQWVEDQGYLTSVPDEYVTQTEMESYTSAFITSADLPSLDGYATEQYVQDYTSAFITESDIPADLVTSGELATVSGDIMSQIPPQTTVSIDPTLQTGTKIAEFNINGTSGELYAPNGGGSTYTAGDHIDITNDVISVTGVSGLFAGENVTITTSGGNYYINSTGGGDVPADVVTSGQLATVSGEIVNQIPDTSDMATKTWVGQQGYLTSIPDEYATSGDLVTLSGAIEADIPSYTAGDNISIVNDEISVSGTAGLIAGENISITASGDNYVISSTGGGGGVEQVYHDGTLTGDGTQADPLSITSASNWTQAYDAINASASSWNDAAGMNEYPISAGPGMSIEDVDGVTVFQTSGTMMDDLIEYNSQDEISGYNGHPVMTVDSEKQWLTHDDTIAHVTNSAQYAFGVNVPVVMRAGGVDETILWESPTSAGTNTSAYTLSESYDNFDRIKVYFRTNDGWGGCNETLSVNSKFPLSVEEFFPTNGNYISKATTAELDGTNMYVSTSGFIAYRASSGGSIYTAVSGKIENQKFYVNRIYGIGRKEN